MADSYTAELRDIIDRAYTELAGRATAAQVHAAVFGSLPDHLTDYLIGKGLRAQVGSYFREKDNDGLPKRPEANPDGEHVQMEYLTVAEFAFVHAAAVARSEANAAQAEKIRLRCIDAHGVDLGVRAVA